MSGDDLAIAWLDGIGALSALTDDWQALADRTGADIYMMPGWVIPWWAHFGAGRRLTTMVARRAGALVALLPFTVETIWAGPVPVRVARLAGTDPHCMVFTLPVMPADQAAVLQQAFDHLLGPGRCHAVSLTPVSARADFLPLAPAGLSVTDRPAGSHVMFDLPDSAEAYQASLSKKRRSQMRRDITGLEQGFGMKAATLLPTASDFAAFVGFHNQQWQAVGKGGHFSDWPGSAAFYQSLCAGALPGRGVRFESLDGAREPLATQFTLIGGQTCHWRLPARTLDPEADRLSIGKVGLVLMIERMIASGVRRIEAGRGEYGYKLSYGGVSVPVHQILVSRPTGPARLRLRLLLGWSDLMNLGYYRLWFRRIAPRLRQVTGMKPAPLWRSWIRTRV